MASDDPAKIRLKMVRGSYLHLFKPKGFGKKNEGDPKFQGTAIIDPNTKSGARNLDMMEEAIDFVGEAKWGKDWPKIKKKLEKDNKICLKEGDEDDENTDGMFLVAASNAKKPLALDENGDDVTEADDVIYSGCRGDMVVRIWAQDNDYGQRINASLEGFRKREDDEPLSSVSRTTKNDFMDDDEDDDRPKRGRGRSRDDEDDGPPKRGRGRSRDDEDDEPPKRGRGRSRDDDDDEDDAPPARRGRGRSRDEDDDAPPARRGRGRDADEDDDAPPARRGRSRDVEDDDPPPRRRAAKDDDGDSKASRRRRSRDDDDDY